MNPPVPPSGRKEHLSDYQVAYPDSIVGAVIHDNHPSSFITPVQNAVASIPILILLIIYGSYERLNT